MSGEGAVKVHTVVSWVHRHGVVHAKIMESSRSRNNPIDTIEATHKACWCLEIVQHGCRQNSLKAFACIFPGKIQTVGRLVSLRG